MTAAASRAPPAELHVQIGRPTYQMPPTAGGSELQFFRRRAKSLSPTIGLCRGYPTVRCMRFQPRKSPCSLARSTC